MNDEINLIVQKLSDLTLNYSVEQIINELMIITERLSFASFDPTKSHSDAAVMTQLIFLLERDISPGLMEFLKYLADMNKLGLCQRDAGQSFIEYCRNYFTHRKQLVMRCPIKLSPNRQKNMAVKLLSLYPVSTRILFEVDPTLIAGYILYEDGAMVQDASFRTRAAVLIEEYIRERTPTTWTQPASQ